jgi:hypothetical protein
LLFGGAEKRKEKKMRIDRWWKWIVLFLVVAGIAIGARNLWPKPVPVAVSSAEPTSTAVAETASACCETVFVDLETSAPEGVWSNSSGILIPEGWCVVLQRDQRWQQSRNEVELRQTWDKGATEDYLLLCNSDPGAKFYSLESEFGGRPRDWWNDQAKAIWVFPDPKVASCRQGTIVLYENDDSSNPGWLFEIPVGGTVR